MRATVSDNCGVKPGQKAPVLRKFIGKDADKRATEFIGTLPGHDTGRYSLDVAATDKKKKKKNYDVLVTMNLKPGDGDPGRLLAYIVLGFPRKPNKSDRYRAAQAILNAERDMVDRFLEFDASTVTPAELKHFEAVVDCAVNIGNRRGRSNGAAH